MSTYTLKHKDFDLTFKHDEFGQPGTSWIYARQRYGRYYTHSLKVTNNGRVLHYETQNNYDTVPVANDSDELKQIIKLIGFLEKRWNPNERKFQSKIYK